MQVYSVHFPGMKWQKHVEENTFSERVDFVWWVFTVMKIKIRRLLKRWWKATLNPVTLEVEDIDLNASVTCSGGKTPFADIQVNAFWTKNLPDNVNSRHHVLHSYKEQQDPSSTTHSGAGARWPVSGCPEGLFWLFVARVSWVPEMDICILHFY